MRYRIQLSGKGVYTIETIDLNAKEFNDYIDKQTSDGIKILRIQEIPSD